MCPLNRGKINLPPDPFPLIEPNGTVFETLPITFSWNSTADPNPDHTVFYDLIISTDDQFVDTVVVYDLVDANYMFSDPLPDDPVDDEYCWKVRAHDLWGESIFSEQTFTFTYTSPGYQYLPGDANMYNGAWPPAVIGGDVTYLVNYFRSSPASQPCLLDGFWASADANGSGDVIGSDVTYLINYLRGGASPQYCPDYPPAWPTPGDLPAEAPSGWPNCDTPSVTGRVLPTGGSK